MNKKMTFEEAMEALELAVAKLENGTLSLDESLIQFEEAVKLIKYCNEKISVAEQKVKILIESEGGEITDKSFLVNENEN